MGKIRRVFRDFSRAIGLYIKSQPQNPNFSNESLYVQHCLLQTKVLLKKLYVALYIRRPLNINILFRVFRLTIVHESSLLLICETRGSLALKYILYHFALCGYKQFCVAGLGLLQYINYCVMQRGHYIAHTAPDMIILRSLTAFFTAGTTVWAGTRNGVHIVPNTAPQSKNAVHLHFRF